MASIKNLKKDINYTLGDLYDICQLNAQLNPEADASKSEEIINELFDTFDELIVKVNAKDVENKKAHFKAINGELEERAKAILDKISAL